MTARIPRTSRTSIITDWHVRDESDLPDVPPGDEYERVIAPQKFVVLRQIFVRGPSLVRLRIGAVPDDGEVRRYRPNGLLDEAIKKQLVKVGAAAAGPNEIAIAPGLEVGLQLRNEGDVPTKPRAALLVQEEIS